MLFPGQVIKSKDGKSLPADAKANKTAAKEKEGSKSASDKDSAQGKLL